MIVCIALAMGAACIAITVLSATRCVAVVYSWLFFAVRAVALGLRKLWFL